jgi:GDP-L-fucose synthase
MKPRTFELDGKRVWVAGHNGMMGSALVRRLGSERCEILTASRAELDLRNQAETEAWVAQMRPDAVLLAAATVGGILANSTRPADFLSDNLAIETNVIHAAHRVGVEKLLFIGSSCVYPKRAHQPMHEDALLTGPLEETIQWYALAKIVGLKLCQAYRIQHGHNFISALPANLYGPNDNFDLAGGHVLAALLRKAHEAKHEEGEIEVWGTGNPKREFMHVDDCADACVHLLKVYDGDSHINVGTGEEVSIRELAELVCDVVGTAARLRFNPTKPDGTPERLLDVASLHALGWHHRVGLREGVASTYEWFVRHAGPRRGVD